GFVLLGGWRLFRPRAGAASSVGALAVAPAGASTVPYAAGPDAGPLELRHRLTALAIAALIVAVAGFKLHVGIVALVCATVLILAHAADESQAIRRMPWGVILMVTGVTVLVALLDKTDGLKLISDGIARVSTPGTIEPVAAFGTGLVS